MQNAKTLDILERAAFLENSVAFISVALIFQRILNMVNAKKKRLVRTF